MFYKYLERELKMKNSKRKVLAFLIVVLLVGAWIVSIFGVGDKFGNLNDHLKYGLDINGGVYVLLEAETKETGTGLTAVMDQTKQVLENRVNAMGISEATVSIEGTNRIRVEMPGVKDAASAIKQIGRTAQLRFMLADGTLALNGDGISDSQLATDTENGGYKITIDFTSEGSDAFAEATEKAASNTVEVSDKWTEDSANAETVASNAVVIMLDDEVISAPTVQQKISSRSCEITRPGGFSQTEASELSALIRGGALPANLVEVNSSVETATIGANALVLSAKAGIIGLAIVMLIMLFAFGILGAVADIALLLYVMIVLWGMAGMGSVLTLPGIAGIILSIGMAVDSNVIIFTRIREEIGKGKNVKVAVDMGYHAALTTVIDAQTTTLIAAIVLYLIGTTSVKGFALTLMLGTVVSIITAVFVTQIFVNLLANSAKLGTPKMFGCNEDGTARAQWKGFVHFIKNKKVFYCISATVIIVGLGFGIIRGFNYGIDFTGGTMMQLEMGKQVEIDDIKDTIKDYKLDPTIVYAGEDNTQIIIKTIKDLKASDREKVEETIIKAYDLDNKAILASEEFGPSVGNDLKHNAVKSILIAGLCMLVYIRFRFNTWKYGLAAVIGLVHDILITLSMYAIFGFAINNPFVAGILTVVGYSINDTIVIFDRIRENSRFFKRKENTELIDTSINQTLGRSIMTSVTTLVVMIPLFVMATSELREFLIPLIIGVTTGTYSSIFLCSPIFYEFTRKESLSRYEEQKEKEAKAKKKNGGIVK